MVDNMKIGLRRSKLAGGFGLLLALVLLVSLSTPALAVPQAGHQFYGTVSIGGVLAPEGTIVSAKIDDVEYESGTVDAQGRYGYDITNLFVVPGDDPEEAGKQGGVDGDIVKFYITNDALGLHDVKANEEAEFVSLPTGAVTNLNLTVSGEVVTYDLTVNVNNTAWGSVTEPGEGVFTRAAGTVVDLLAEPEAGYEFLNWTGDVSTIDDVNAADTFITMNGDYSITANFSVLKVSYFLTMEVVGQGTVTPGSGSYTEGEIPITATPAAGWWFASWSTDNMTEIAEPSLASTTLNLDKDKTVTATFTEITVLYADLLTGWNTFSVPTLLQTDYDTLGELQAAAGLDIGIAYYFNGTTQMFVQALAGYQMLPCDAIIIKMNAPGTVPIYPSLLPWLPSKAVYAGWNLIGSAFLDESKSVEEALVTLYYAEGELKPWGYTQVISPAYNQPGWVHTRDGVSYYMLIFKGYYVSMDNDDIYMGQQYTPLP
jgi:hypothetical protein